MLDVDIGEKRDQMMKKKMEDERDEERVHK